MKKYAESKEGKHFFFNKLSPFLPTYYETYKKITNWGEDSDKAYQYKNDLKNKYEKDLRVALSQIDTGALFTNYGITPEEINSFVTNQAWIYWSNLNRIDEIADDYWQGAKDILSQLER